MTDQFPDATKMVPVPPPELVQQWLGKQYGRATVPGEATIHVATQAARWGADQELEACCKWFANEGYGTAPDRIRMHRRPEPPTLKEQALEALEVEDDAMPLRSLERGERFALIRRALEALPND
jgi:hypothetical protein